MAFIEHVDTAPNLFEPLQDRVFSSGQYRFWQQRSESWRLRLIGGPGSGKTTLAASIVSQLQREALGKNARVAAIFFISRSSQACALIRFSLLGSVHRQITYDQSNSEIPSDTSTPDENFVDLMSLTDLRESIRTHCAAFDQVSLVIDALDLCSPDQTAVIEEELVFLQGCRIAILTTSRLALWSPLQFRRCDALPRMRPPCTYDSMVMWQCPCNPTSTKVYCDSCKMRGYKCQECGGGPEFILCHGYGDFCLKVGSGLMAQFVARELELFHGDLDLASSISVKPPHSRLGRALAAAQDETAAASRKILQTIVANADGNIALAKLCIEHCETFENLEDALRYEYTDRLPENMFAFFDECVKSTFEGESVDKVLGLRSLIWSSDMGDGKLEELQDWLDGNCETDALTQRVSETLETIIHAARGFLTFDQCNQGPPGEFYSYAEWFGCYVRNDYNAQLYATRQSLSRRGDTGPP